MKLSIAMMVKNESKHLRKCLESLKSVMKGVTSELIIVDTGSEDNTVEIAKEYTSKVYFHQWNGNFSDMRNISISYTRGDWILIIDGDEEVENPQQLLDFLKSNKSRQYNSGVVTIKSYSTESDELLYGTLLIPRLFKNYKGFKYEGAIHEQPKVKLPVCNIGVQLLHYGYVSTDKELMERKFHRNIDILQSELEKDPDNFYYHYQVALTYAMHKDYKEALEANIKALEVAKNNKVDFTRCMYLYTNLAILNYFNKNYEEAEKTCKEALHIRDGYIDIYYILGKAQMSLGKKQDSIDSFEMYLKIHDNYHNYDGSKDTGVINYTLGHGEEVYLELFNLYDKDEEYYRALNYLRKITSEKVLRGAMSKILRMFLTLNKEDDLIEFYTTTIKDGNVNLKDEFIIYLEKNIEELSLDARTRIFRQFVSQEDSYSILNKIRLQVLNNNTIDKEIISKLKTLEINDLPNYYGEIIYYLLKHCYNIAEVFPNLRETTLQSHLNYLLSKADLCSLINFYLRKQETSINLNQIRINKSLANYILVQNQINKEEYKYIFGRYIEDGIRYISHVYNSIILEHELIYDLKTSEEAFLTYMYHGKKIIHSDKVQYIKYLRKALKVYPEMKQGVEMLMNEVTQLIGGINHNSNNSSHEDISKTYITQLVHENKTKEALELINKYEIIRPDDIEINSIKAVIAITENRLEDAQEILEYGLKSDPNNFDLMYNMAYLKQVKGKYEEAISYYEQAKGSTDDRELLTTISNTLEQLYNQLVMESKVSEKADDINKQSDGDQLEGYKTQVKDKIKELIDDSKLQDCTILINEYEKIVPNDLEILLFKSQIAIAENQ